MKRTPAPVDGPDTERLCVSTIGGLYGSRGRLPYPPFQDAQAPAMKAARHRLDVADRSSTWALFHALSKRRARKYANLDPRRFSMYGRERRQSGEQDPQQDPAALRAGLRPAQIRALETLEQFGWTLRFVRQPMFQDPVPVAFDRKGERWVVLEADGSLNESPGFRIRD